MRTPIEFCELAVGELTLSSDGESRDSWKLQHDEELVGHIQRSPEATRVRGRSGCWRVERARHRLDRRLLFRPVDTDEPMASYYPRHLLPGGTLALSDEHWFELRPPGVFGKAWKLSDEEGREFTRIPISSQGWPAREWLLHLDERSASEPAALLVVLATCYAIVADQAQNPLSTG